MEHHVRPSTDSRGMVDDESSLSSHDDSGDLEKALLSVEESSKRDVSQSRAHLLVRPSTWLTVFNIGVFVASCIVWSGALSKQTLKDQDFWKATSFYCKLMAFNSRCYFVDEEKAPILERFEIPKVTRVTNGTLYDPSPPSILRQRIGKEVDDEWHRIGDHVWPLVIGAEDVRLLGKDPAVAVKIPDDLGYGSDAYIAQTEVFHHLHCLDMLRREVSYEHYYEEKEGPKPGGAQHQAHIGHCFDILAQAIKCTGSVDMITFNWVESWNQPFPDFMNHKVCRNFDVLLDWVNDNSMDPEVFQKMKTPPPGWPVLPEPGTAR